MHIRGRLTVVCAALALVLGVPGLLAPSRAAACSVGPLMPVGVPQPGATGVSTATSIIVLSQGQPDGLILQAGGLDVPLTAPTNLGRGDNGNGFTGGLSFWRVRAATGDGMLTPSAEHVLTGTYEGTRIEITRFTTANGYDKEQGVAPVAKGLHLWRVRYPLSEIRSGDCVFDEYHGFVTVDYEPGRVPNTPPSSVVHTFQLAPKTGGSPQVFNYVGATPFVGLEPKGNHPLPNPGTWEPELDPTREYCLTITAFGDGDIARLPLSSQPICATVVQLSSAGAPPSPVSSNSGGGCSVTGDSDTAGLSTLVASFLLAVGSAIRRRRSGPRRR